MFTSKIRCKQLQSTLIIIPNLWRNIEGEVEEFLCDNWFSVNEFWRRLWDALTKNTNFSIEAVSIILSTNNYKFHAKVNFRFLFGFKSKLGAGHKNNIVRQELR